MAAPACRGTPTIAGHFGLAPGVKGREPGAPLWSLMLATVCLDIVFVPLAGVGVESVSPAPGTAGGYGSVIISADWTHSLVGALVLAVLFGAVAAIPWVRRAGAVPGGVVFSHWLPDLVVHRKDMPILPANACGLPRLGKGRGASRRWRPRSSCRSSSPARGSPGGPPNG